MNQSWSEIVELKNNIQEKIHHSFLNNKLENLHIDPCLVGIIRSLLQDLHVPKEKLNSYVTALTLVKTALDLHELVDKNQLNKTQMIILAGDLYSGYYYELLSKIDEVGLVREIALGIKETNMKKIQILRDYGDENELPFQLLKQSEIAIIEKVGAFLGNENDVKQATNLLYLNRLIREYKQSFSKSTIYQSCFTKENVDDYYEALQQEIKKQVEICSDENIQAVNYQILREKIMEQL
ncbi:MAG: heptaprenyl diphosphate synthase component 1 [Bacillaceae bacterium]